MKIVSHLRKAGLFALLCYGLGKPELLPALCLSFLTLAMVMMIHFCKVL